MHAWQEWYLHTGQFMRSAVLKSSQQMGQFSTLGCCWVCDDICFLCLKGLSYLEQIKQFFAESNTIVFHVKQCLALHSLI